MPVFARTGTVLPLKPLGDHAGDHEERREIRVYAGDDGPFELYDHLIEAPLTDWVPSFSQIR